MSKKSRVLEEWHYDRLFGGLIVRGNDKAGQPITGAIASIYGVPPYPQDDCFVSLDTGERLRLRGGSHVIIPTPRHLTTQTDMP